MESGLKGQNRGHPERSVGKALSGPTPSEELRGMTEQLSILPGTPARSWFDFVSLPLVSVAMLRSEGSHLSGVSDLFVE